MTATKDGKQLKALGILKFEEEDDEVWMCYGLPGSPRPTEFASKANSKNMLFELQRQTGSAGVAEGAQ